MDSAGGSVEDSSGGGIYGQDTRTLLYSEIADTVWFASNEYRFDFPEDQDKKIVYLNYMPDGANTEKWIQLTADENGITKAKIIYSTNIREIGKTSTAYFYRTGDGNVCFKCDFLSASGMQLASENSASIFDYEKVPALKADYLSNFDGKYKLNTKGWELQIGAKLSITQDLNHYWFANVLATEYDENTKTYDLLLAHTSQKGASGSTSPGITGNEPFITRQGLFWNHCLLKNNGGGTWKIQWASNWYDSPAEAMESALDMDDTFSGPASAEMHYVFNFYFGKPVQDSDGWWTVERGEWIGAYKEDSNVAKTWTWGEIKSHIPSYTIPEDKIVDYWWYGSPNSFYVNKDSYVHELNSDSAVLSLENYDIYLALKDKLPVGKELPTNGTFISSKDSVNPLLFEGSTLKYGSNSYIVKDLVQWSSSTNNECWALLLDDGISTYCAAFYWYTHYKGELLVPDYMHWYPPKLYSGELPASTNFSIMNSRIKDYERQ